MSARTTTALLALLIAIGGSVLYVRGLNEVPPYLIHDEAQGALQAHSIATTGHDLSCRLLPLYFTEPEFPPGRDPALIYVTALGLKVLPFGESGARTPTAMVAVLNLVLMFLAARVIFQSTWLGLLAAVLLALTPIHFIRGRLLLSPLYSIPFVIGWLWSLRRFELQPTTARFVGTCAWLAAGMYSYLAAVVMMPLYLLMTLGVAARSLTWKRVSVAAGVFVLCLVPMAAWYVTHPERNSQIVSAYQLTSEGPWLSSVVAAIGARINLYWLFFDPAYLFVSGDASMVNSTRQSGLFPLAFAALLPIGVITLVRSREPFNLVLAAGFLAAPIVSVISGAIEMNRVMFAIPFAVLVATYGAIVLGRTRAMLPRVIGMLLVASVAWQFAGFYRGYRDESYRASAAPWFSGNSREALQELMARANGSDIYISQEIEWVHRMWRFYAIEAGRLDLVATTNYFRTAPVAAPGSKALCTAESAICGAMVASGEWRHISTVTSFEGARHFAILERTAADKSP